jgi:hypothetical protein
MGMACPPAWAVTLKEEKSHKKAVAKNMLIFN